MTALDIIVDHDLVNSFLIAHDLEHGYAPLQTALMQGGGTSSQQPAVLLVFEVDGKNVVGKTTLRLLEAMCHQMRFASGIDLDGKPLG